MSGGCCPVDSSVVASELVGRSPDEHSSLSTRSAKFPTRCLNSVGPASRPGVYPSRFATPFHAKEGKDWNVIMLKDPMKRLWPVFYHENPVFMGFTTGWKPFVEANNLQIGNRCELLKELDEEAGTSVPCSDHKKK